MAPAADKYKPKDFKDSIRHFTPAWFAVNMGTGAISILFGAFPFSTGAPSLRILSLVFFGLNLVLFTVFLTISAIRYLWFKDIWYLMLRHPVQSLYIGTFPMGAATLINVAVSVIYQDYGFGGKSFLYALWAFWWLDVAVSVFSAWGMVHIMITRHEHAVSRMTAMWLLPVVALIVASSSGGVIAPALTSYSLSHALLTTTLSVFLVSIGLTLAFMIQTIYLLRLITHGLPTGATIISSFIPVGPCGQAGFSVLLIGQAYKQLFPLAYGDSAVLTAQGTGEIINVVCVCVGFVLWALASMWVLFAFLGTWEIVRRQRFPFKVPFWGLIFPNGVYANLTIELYKVLDSEFFRVWGAIYAVGTMVLWLWVFVRSAHLTGNGLIFEAPCLEDIDMTGYDRSRTPCANANGGVNGAQTVVEKSSGRIGDERR